ncbi:MAG TPA: hypothetical protein VIV40_13925 [Kofleriaceae bacterium]
MPASLPSFARGLKLIRFAVFLMLLQLVLGIVMTVKSLGADSLDDARDALEWTKYFMLANTGAAFAMFIGVARAIPELSRVRMNIRGMIVAAVGFAITAAALAWTYKTLSHFVDVALDPASSLDDIMSSAEDLKSTRQIVIVKDLAYAVGLIAVLRTIQRSAAINDQLALRDEAASMARAMIVMLVADLFWQLTYGLGGSYGLTGLLGSLLVGIYWIYCHVRLQRFLYNAAYFVNEPHDLPVATIVVRDTAQKPAERPARNLPERPSQKLPVRPSAPPPIVVVQPPPRVEPPRAEPAGDAQSDGPRFLR